MRETSDHLCRVEAAVLLLIDIQEKLAAAMGDEARERVVRGAGILAEAAVRLGVPRLLTEQYPRGLGPTEPRVLERLDTAVLRFEKTSFSCCGVESLNEALRATGRCQVIIAGMESHVCVLQTALDLVADGWQVVVAEDATCSRNRDHHRNAMSRMRQAGVVVANTESIVFEWMRDARHEQFKAISALVR